MLELNKYLVDKNIQTVNVRDFLKSLDDEIDNICSIKNKLHEIFALIERTNQDYNLYCNKDGATVVYKVTVDQNGTPIIKEDD